MCQTSVEETVIAFFFFENGKVKKTSYLTDTEVELLKLAITLLISWVIAHIIGS